MTPERFLDLLRTYNAARLLAKRLACNDNAKNQVYLGGDFAALNVVPHRPMVEDASTTADAKRVRLKAGLDFYWLDDAGCLEPAGGANLILYPRYPEVRLSGILTGVRNRSWSPLISSRTEGRWLFLATVSDGRILAHVVGPGTPLAVWAESALAEDGHGALLEFPLPRRQGIREALAAIAAKGWIPSKRLTKGGHEVVCRGTNCGGYTLEAELGVRPNSRSTPDYDGWEVKQFQVSDIDHPTGDRITLFTPEPDGGVYRELGIERFLRRFGYPDKRGRVDRLNFGGHHVCGVRNSLTRLTLSLVGWDSAKETVADLDGGLVLADESGEEAAKWSYTALINHWSTKHARAVYVPGEVQPDPLAYRFGSRVLACQGTGFSLFVRAFSNGLVVYDPGIKMEQASTGSPKFKKRSQFRIPFKHVPMLYRHAGWWDLHRSAS